MKRINIQVLLLELTRKCNLSCMHCFRGNSEDKYMSLDLIDKIFKNSARINTLLLTGGEPLLALEQLERIRDNIVKDRTNVGEVIIVTNGTVLSKEIISILYDISTRADLKIKVSNDQFHELELIRNNLKEKKQNNIELLNVLFDVELEHPTNNVYIIDRVGRAKNLTQKDLDYISSIDKNNVRYVFSTDKSLEIFRNNYPVPSFINEDVVEGSLNIDVFGNITPTYYSFNEEDDNRYSNIRGNKTLKKAIDNIKI